MYRITRSQWRKAAALVVAVGVFVLLDETRMLDSHRVAELLLGEEASVTPGAAPLQFSATAYCKGTTTASGVRVRTGIVAADPTLLPVGSVVNVDAGDARYNGVYTVMDTGPAVRGRTLDLYIWSCHEALRFGRRRVRVTVLRLGWDPKASSPTLAERLFRRREAARAREIAAQRSSRPEDGQVDPDALPDTTSTQSSGADESAAAAR
jgi:3D (Asp-Asp-Asp) domain-containing protein